MENCVNGYLLEIKYIHKTDFLWFYRFVHGTCDTEADLTMYNRRKESNPEYEYICPICKPRTQPGKEIFPKRKDSKYRSVYIHYFDCVVFIMTCSASLGLLLFIAEILILRR